LQPGNPRTSRRWPDLPTLLLLACWVGIWFLWPSGAAPAARADRRPSPTRFVYAGPAGEDAEGAFSPLAFLRARPGAAPAGEPGEVDVPRSLAGAEPAFLKAPPTPARRPAPEPPKAAQEAAARLGAYRPRWNGRPAFAAREPGAPRLTWEATAPLRGRGFALPELPAEELRAAAAPWQAVFYVVCGADGTVEHVLLETGPADKELTGALVRLLYRGRAAAGAAGCAGRVTVSYGRNG